MPIKFRFRLIPFVAAAVAVAIGVAAGNWQTRRAEQKLAIEATMAARDSAAPQHLGADAPALAQVEYARVRVRGSFVADWPLYLDNRPQQGRAGFYLLMPFKIEGSQDSIVVLRGWAPRNLQDRLALPVLTTPAGIIELEGMVKKDAGRVMQLGSAPAMTPNVLLQNLDLAALSAASKLTLLPYVLEQHSNTADGLTRDWPRASSGIDKHRGYAFQWYGLAAAALIFFLVTGFRRESTQKH